MTCCQLSVLGQEDIVKLGLTPSLKRSSQVKTLMTEIDILIFQPWFTAYFESWLTERGGPTLEAREQLRKRTETPRPSRRDSERPEEGEYFAVKLNYFTLNDMCFGQKIDLKIPIFSSRIRCRIFSLAGEGKECPPAPPEHHVATEVDHSKSASKGKSS